MSNGLPPSPRFSLFQSTSLLLTSRLLDQADAPLHLIEFGAQNIGNPPLDFQSFRGDVWRGRTRHAQKFEASQTHNGAEGGRQLPPDLPARPAGKLEGTSDRGRTSGEGEEEAKGKNMEGKQKEGEEKSRGVI